MLWWHKKKRKGYTVICCSDYKECKEKLRELRLSREGSILLSQTSLHHWSEKLSGRPIEKYYGISKELLLNYGSNVLADAEKIES